MAATQDKTRLRRINGYGPKAFEAKIVLTTIHKISTPVNVKMNAQLPANFAIASAARCPSVYFSVVGFSEILLLSHACPCAGWFDAYGGAAATGRI